MPASNSSKYSGDSFSTFLQTVKKKGPAATSAAQEPQRAEPERVAPLDLLRHLESERPTPVSDLMSECGLSLFEFTEALKAVKSAGLVELETAGGPERIRLTPMGARLVKGE